MRFTFEVAGDVQIDRELLRVGAHAADAAPAFGAIADLMMAETKEQFSSAGRHASGGWAPLRPATVAFKRAHGFRPQVLQRTGSLLDSLTQRGDGNQILEVKPDSLTFGTRLPYGIWHQKGTKTMPRRRPIEFTEETRRAIVKILQRWILKGELV